jgi:hypothetical protein
MQYDTSDPKYILESQIISLFNIRKKHHPSSLSSMPDLKEMFLSTHFVTSAIASYQKKSKAIILQINIQAFSGIFLLVNMFLLLVLHTIIVIYTWVRSFGK